ncbi:hypothetical protein QBC44DRAFT_326220 [Cladorrhinum sp. PSN332]|nr:hypothetical protein QBC44DRAFT_326220 [Cladorrhinum sp. PSN332]
MAEEQQINVPSLLIILFVSALILKYFFFSPSTPNGNGNGRRQGVDPVAAMWSREAAVERIQLVFPQLDRRTILWDLQRTGGNITATTDRILSGRLEAPPITFQPPPLPGQQQASSATNNNNNKGPSTPAQPDLITRYNLKDKLNAPVEEEKKKEEVGNGKKAWSQNKEERQSLLQARRDQMILEARRKMEAKIKAEKEKAAGGGGNS